MFHPDRSGDPTAKIGWSVHLGTVPLPPLTPSRRHHVVQFDRCRSAGDRAMITPSSSWGVKSRTTAVTVKVPSMPRVAPGVGRGDGHAAHLRRVGVDGPEADHQRGEKGCVIPALHLLPPQGAQSLSWFLQKSSDVMRGFSEYSLHNITGSYGVSSEFLVWQGYRPKSFKGRVHPPWVQPPTPLRNRCRRRARAAPARTTAALAAPAARARATGGER